MMANTSVIKLPNNRTSKLIFLSFCIGLAAGCTRSNTLADELEGKIQMTPAEKERARTFEWEDLKGNGSQNLPFFSLQPAIGQILTSNKKWQINLSGGNNTGSVVKLLNTARTKSLNHLEGPELVARLLNSANIKPKDFQPGSSRLLFREKLLFLVSIDPAILLAAPAYRDFNQQMLKFQIPYRSFTLSTETVSEGFRQGSSVFLLNVFPDNSDIEVISDQWSGVRTLAQMEADARTPFKAVPAANMPGFLRLVLKDSAKTGQ
ncbi:MAG: hypothetical protein Q7V00_13140 [Sulfurimicrobium sp.]|nr:hypothetical protein [Sulfurimicrobium sp.]MDP1705472.1 hypothetical protein [Sulfurimicrobium sp.]MDP2198848.1 hypothetical protein [Sulfurimicrobium sp.]MDP3686890.1 hypothetical protein [Sulfurimicrobium sp.]